MDSPWSVSPIPARRRSSLVDSFLFSLRGGWSWFQHNKGVDHNKGRDAMGRLVAIDRWPCWTQEYHQLQGDIQPRCTHLVHRRSCMRIAR